MLSKYFAVGGAMASAGKSAGKSDEDTGDESLRNLADKIAKSSFRDPIGFLFESHIPAFTILYSIFLMTEPFISPFVSSDLSSALKTLYENPEKRDWFLSEIAPKDLSETPDLVASKIKGSN